MEPSTSLVADIACYLRTRILTGRILVLLLLVCAASVLSTAAVAPAAVPATVGLMALLVAQLRLWDDLADRSRDSMRFPERLLVRTRHAPSFAWTLLTSVVLVAAVLAWRGQLRELAVYTALLTLLALLYHTGPGADLPRPLRVSLVLAKYPLLLLIATGGKLAPRAWLVALGLYALLVAFEWYDDRELRAGTTLSSTAAAWSCGTVIVLVAFLL